MIKRHKNNGGEGAGAEGFTLIEPLVVIAIISILASTVIIGLSSTRRLARDSRRIADVRQIQSALELYFNKCFVYPGGAIGATAPPECNGVGIPGHMVVNPAWGIAKIPADPSSGAAYDYCHDPDASQYALHAALEDAGNSALRQSPKDNSFCTTFTAVFVCSGPRDYCAEP